MFSKMFNKDKPKVSSYNKDKREFHFNFKKIGIILSIIAILVLVGGFMSYYLMAENKKVKETEEAAKPCSALATADGKTEVTAPYHGIVKSQINGSLDPAKEVCVWRIDGKDAGRTRLEDGYCTRAGLDYYAVGKHQVALTVLGSSCNQSIEINISSLSEEQKQKDLQDKISGETQEDINLKKE
jgi:hypothetical protein